jgi:hypothetical protein
MAEKAFTLRLDEEVYEEIRKRADTTVSQFVREAIASYLEDRRRDEMAKGLASLVDDDFDRKPLKRAQRRVIEGDHD